MAKEQPIKVLTLGEFLIKLPGYEYRVKRLAELPDLEVVHDTVYQGLYVRLAEGIWLFDVVDTDNGGEGFDYHNYQAVSKQQPRLIANSMVGGRNYPPTELSNLSNEIQRHVNVARDIAKMFDLELFGGLHFT